MKQKQFEEEFFTIVDKDLERRGIPKSCLYEGEIEALYFYYCTKVLQAINLEKAGLDIETALKQCTGVNYEKI